MKKIIINKNLKFSSDDLTQYVDVTKSFTLKDIFNCIKNSKVSIKSLKKILKCNYLEEYIEEINKKNKETNEKQNIKHLEVYCCAEGFDEDNKDKLVWRFDGVGEKDINGCSRYGLDFTPLYKMADLEVKVSNIITRYDLPIKNKDGISMVKETKFIPLIMLVELLYTIVWELSWNGSIKNRDAKLKELIRRVNSIKEENKSKKY